MNNLNSYLPAVIFPPPDFLLTEPKVTSFDFSEYEIVQNTREKHIRNPTVVFYYGYFYVNSCCIKLFPEYTYIQILINSNHKKLILFPHKVFKKDCFVWCNQKGNGKQITSRLFCAKIYRLMNWDVNYSYSCFGEVVSSNQDQFLIFDLSSAKIHTYKPINKIVSFDNDKFGINYKEYNKLQEIPYFNNTIVLKFSNNDIQKEGDMNETIS